MKEKYSYAFIGGDMRQFYLMQYLIDSGESCITYGLPELTGKRIKSASSLKEAVSNAKYILCPIPFLRYNMIDTEELLSLLSKRHVIYGGCLPDKFTQELTQQGIAYHDYMKSEHITLFNTIATAEGIIAEAIMKYPGNLHHAKCLLIGYGRCGRTLADKLKGLGADVTVCARRKESLAEADSLGLKGILLSDLKSTVYQYNVIFNTVPERILTKPILEELDQSSYIFDIASAPGGVDYDAAKELGLEVGLYPGLPGKYAPEASAGVLYEFIMQTK